MNKKFHRTLNFILASALLLISIIACGSQPAPSVYGQWRGSYDDVEMTLVLESNGTITISSVDSTYTGTFTLDTNTTPMQLDMNYAELGYVQTILEFVDENTIRIENSIAGDERPTAFSDVITLTRDQ
jgi:hypothetical protein